MPETAVNEYGNPRFQKNKVWFSRQWVTPAPTPYPPFAHQTHERAFCRRVAFAKDSRHRVGALLLGQIVQNPENPPAVLIN